MLSRPLSFVLAAMFSAVLLPYVEAGIVLTPVQTSLPQSNDVTINLYARWDGNITIGAIPNPVVNSAKVGAYQFRLEISGGTVAGLAAQHNLSPSSAWSNVAPHALIPLISPVITGQKIDWRAANTSAVAPDLIPNATIGIANTAATLLGTIQFTAPSGNYTLSFTPLTSGDYNAISGFAYINSNAPNDQFAHTFVGPPTMISVASVPEPCTMVLTSLGTLVAIFFNRKRSAKPNCSMN